MIVKIPTEVLIQVFWLSLPQPVDDKGRWHLRSLRSTCSAWRTLIDGTPEIWSTLSVDIDDLEERLSKEQYTTYQEPLLAQPTIPRVISTIRAWLDRAAECLLTLQITKGSVSSPIQSQNALQAVADLILEHRNWFELDIHISLLNALSPGALHDVFSCTTEEGPYVPWKKLNRFSIGHTSPRGSSLVANAEPWSVSLDKCAPALEELEVTTLRLTLINLNISLIVTNIVRYLPNLRRLFVHAYNCAVSPDMAISDLVVSNLIQEVDVCNDAACILNDLSLPCLQSLTVGSDTGYTLSDASWWAEELIRRSECYNTLRRVDMRTLEFYSPRCRSEPRWGHGSNFDKTRAYSSRKRRYTRDARRYHDLRVLETTFISNLGVVPFERQSTWTGINLSDKPTHCQIHFGMGHNKRRCQPLYTLSQTLMSLTTFPEQGWCKAQRPAISRFPIELLTEVFKYSLPLPLDHGGRQHFLSLRSTCSAWRALSFSTPRLWSGLHIDAQEVRSSSGGSGYGTMPLAERLGSPNNINPTRLIAGPKLLSLIRAWFDRASNSPLIFRLTNENGDDDQYRLRDLLDLAYDDRRWLELDIDIPIDIGMWGNRDMLSKLTKTPYKPWKDLRRLTLRCEQYGWEDLAPFTSLVEGLIPLDTCAPAVQRLKLSLERMCASLPHPQHSITTLHLVLVQVNINFIAKNVVGQLPNLHRLSVKGKQCTKWTPTPEWPQSTLDHLSPTSTLSVDLKSPIISNSIRDLEVGRDGIYILNYFSLPSLQHLRVGSGSMGFEGSPVDFIVDLIRRSGCKHTLRKLDLRKLRFDVPRETASDSLRKRIGSSEGVKYLV
ncbi:hypothetical protein BKA70DRAFT_1400228 [Coprinopsis sp. MPI-PUGE-AT-0042]|nr:hypothetical protein BKA70DRAFT_1400228 [Coprinopsis sp. MPI-PUGE-AT-0042]